MTVKEWMDKYGYTLDSDVMPDVPARSELHIPEELQEGLTDEEKSHVFILARECGNMEHIKTYIEWIKAGDIVLHNRGSSEAGVLAIIKKDLKSIFFNEHLEPVQPLEYFSFWSPLNDCVVLMRFRHA